jgi:hypothetical protein
MSSLSQAKAPEIVVLDTVASSAADLSVANGLVTVGTGKPFRRKDVADNAIQLDYFLNATAEVKNIYVTTPVANQEYRFVIEQEYGGKVNEVLVSYTPSVSTGATFATGLTAAIQAKINGGQLKGTVAEYTPGSDYGATFTASTSYPVFRVLQTSPSTLTVSSGIAVQTGTTTDAAISSGVLTITKSSHGYAVGDTVRFYGYTGTINGIASSTAGGFIGRVMTSATNNFTMWVESSSSFVCAYGDVRVTKVAQARRGTGSDLITLLGSDKGITSTNVYHVVSVSGLDSSNGNSVYTKNPVPFQKLYLISSTGSAANAIALMARFKEVKNWYVAGGTTFDPALMS